MTTKKYATLILIAAMALALTGSLMADSCKFQWKDTAGKYMDLEYGEKKVLRYMYEHNTSTEDERLRTYKPFYHVFDLEGENIITKGDGGRYTHHRGIFHGYKVYHNDTMYDFWHMKLGRKNKKDKVIGIDQVHIKVLDKTNCTHTASLTSQINWVNQDGKVIVEEARKVTVSKDAKDGLVVIDVDSTLKALAGDLKFSGDPEHAGLHFRASNAVFESKNEADKSMYLYNDPGVLKNAKKSKRGYKFDTELLDNNPWTAMTFGLNGKKYTVQHMNSKTNPKPYHYSAYRNYGRFGSFGEFEIKKDNTQNLSWRIIVEEDGNPQREVMQKRYQQFTK